MPFAAILFVADTVVLDCSPALFVVFTQADPLYSKI